MNILLLGATGFIGRHIAHTLHTQGHHIVTPQLPHGQRFNMAQMTTPAAWLPHLRLQGLPGLDTQTVDAVINAVGVLRERAGQPMRVVHTLAPMALFTACADVGVRRVIQVSALGIDDIATPYAQTKREADAALLALVDQGRLDAVVLRPSIVMGHGGASTALFQALARLPMLVWPQRATTCQVQPLSVQDLAWGCARLLDDKLLINQKIVTGIVAAVGDERASVAQWVARIRTQMGHRDALICTIPNALAAASARLGDAMPLTPWGRNTWALLSKNNIAEAQAWTAILGRNPSPALSFMAEDAIKYKAPTPTEV